MVHGHLVVFSRRGYARKSAGFSPDRTRQRWRRRRRRYDATSMMLTREKRSDSRATEALRRPYSLRDFEIRPLTVTPAFAFKITRLCCVPLHRRNSYFSLSVTVAATAAVIVFLPYFAGTRCPRALSSLLFVLLFVAILTAVAVSLSLSTTSCRCVFSRQGRRRLCPRHARFANSRLNGSSCNSRDSTLSFHEFLTTPKRKRNDSKLHSKIR